MVLAEGIEKGVNALVWNSVWWKGDRRMIINRRIVIV